jgi:signal transduction histidine kinase
MGFGGLLLLLSVLGLSAISFLYQIEIRHERIRQDYVERERILEKLRSGIYISGTYVRDFLLDTSETLAAHHKAQFLETRKQVENGVAEYRRLIRPVENETFQEFTRELNAYFAATAPTLDWTLQERRERGYEFIRDELLPRRLTAVGLTDRIEQLIEAQLEAGSETVSELFASFRVKLLVLLVLSLVIGSALAGATLWRLFRLEHEANVRFQEVANARRELEQLSAQLVSVQESERRRISRELHDEVGQMLSAVILGLGNLRSAVKANNTEETFRQLQLIQDMTERNVSVVRNISLLLRPAMLDDLGLIPALKWLAREVSRTTSIQVDTLAEGCLDNLPEEHRTCVYRVVQEAVRNASRHSGATHVRIHTRRQECRLRVSVQDDGRGFDTSAETGLGILGMGERIAHLGGDLHVDSERGRGTIVWFELPLPEVLPSGGDQEISPFRTA